MCLLVIAYKQHPVYPLILLANRDEYYDRPTERAHFWKEAPYLLAGTDLKGGGTWLGITKSGRIAAITNYRDPKNQKPGAPSRGMLVRNYLLGADKPLQYLQSLKPNSDEYNGFNLVVGNTEALYWYSNRGNGIVPFESGVYGLSNHLLDTPWPKVTRVKQALKNLIVKDTLPPEQAFFEILEDRTPAPDHELPDTGVGLEWERILSPIFITSPVYGTRSSTVIFIDISGKVRFLEKVHDGGASQPSFQEFVFSLEARAP